jgi:hypothetical protein
MPLVPALVVFLVLAGRYARVRRIRSKPEEPVEAGMAPGALPAQDVDTLDRSLPTAVFLVGGRNELGPHLLRVFAERCAQDYPQALFLAVGVVDASVADPTLPSMAHFERTREAKELRRFIRLTLDPYVEAAHALGLKADCRISISTNPTKEIARLIDGVVGTFPRPMFFIGKLVFEHARWYHRVLHSRSSDTIREYLERRGIPVTVVPVVLAANQMKALERI